MHEDEEAIEPTTEASKVRSLHAEERDPSGLLWDRAFRDHRPHALVREDAGKTLARLRTRLMIPPHWSITLVVACPEDLPRENGRCTWDCGPNHSYQIAIRCNLSPELQEWVLAHELMEAMLSGYGDFAFNLIDGVRNTPLRKHLEVQHGDTRDEYIEWMLRVILHRDRPDAWPPVGGMAR